MFASRTIFSQTRSLQITARHLNIAIKLLSCIIVHMTFSISLAQSAKLVKARLK